MADTIQTLTLLQLAQEFKNDIVSQSNRMSTLAKCLPVVADGGKNCAWVAKNTGMVTELYAEGADAANFGSDSQDAAVLAWASYRSAFHVSGLALATSGTASSPEANLRLWLSNIKDASASLASTINSQLFVGVTGGGIVGLETAIGAATGTYAGIDRAAKTYWQPNLSGPGTAAAVKLTDIRADLTAIFKKSGEFPDLAFVGPDTYTVLASLFDNSVRRIDPRVSDSVTTAKGLIVLDGGIGAIQFGNCQFVMDKDATEGKIFYVNSRYVDIHVLPMDMSNMSSADRAELQGDDGFGPLPLGFQLEMLAKAGDSDKCQMKSYLQLAVRRPNSCGIRKNVSTVPADYV